MSFKLEEKAPEGWRPAVDAVFEFKEDVEHLIKACPQRELRFVETDEPATHLAMFGEAISFVALDQAKAKAEAYKKANEAAYEERQKEWRLKNGPWFAYREIGKPTVEKRDLGFLDKKGRKVGVRIKRELGEYVEDPNGRYNKERAGLAHSTDIHLTFNGRVSCHLFYKYRDPGPVPEAELEKTLEERIVKLKQRYGHLPKPPSKKELKAQQPKLADGLRNLATRLMCVPVKYGVNQADCDFLNRVASILGERRDDAVFD